jgi:hypothetical protein
MFILQFAILVESERRRLAPLCVGMHRISRCSTDVSTVGTITVAFGIVVAATTIGTGLSFTRRLVGLIAHPLVMKCHRFFAGASVDRVKQHRGLRQQALPAHLFAVLGRRKDNTAIEIIPRLPRHLDHLKAFVPCSLFDHENIFAIFIHEANS